MIVKFPITTSFPEPRLTIFKPLRMETPHDNLQPFACSLLRNFIPLYIFAKKENSFGWELTALMSCFFFIFLNLISFYVLNDLRHTFCKKNVHNRSHAHRKTQTPIVVTQTNRNGENTSPNTASRICAFTKSKKLCDKKGYRIPKKKIPLISVIQFVWQSYYIIIFFVLQELAIKKHPLGCFFYFQSCSGSMARNFVGEIPKFFLKILEKYFSSPKPDFSLTSRME